MAEPLAKRWSQQENRFYRRLAVYAKVISTSYLGILAFLMFSETRLVFPGAGVERGDWTHPGVELEEVDFESSDGTKLHGHFFPKPGSSEALLICHGNAENVALMAEEADRFRQQLNLNVFVFDFRGFGKSLGKPSESAVLADAQAASAWLAERVGCDESELFLFGRSLGGGIAVDLAGRNGTKGLILDRTFSSAVDVAASRYWWLPIRFVMRNQFLSIAKIGRYRGPLLQLHGDVDEVIPLWSAQRLFDFSPSPEKEFRLVPGLAHTVPMPESFYRDMDDFIASIAKPTTEASPSPTDLRIEKATGS